MEGRGKERGNGGRNMNVLNKRKKDSFLSFIHLIENTMTRTFYNMSNIIVKLSFYL